MEILKTAIYISCNKWGKSYEPLIQRSRDQENQENMDISALQTCYLLTVMCASIAVHCAPMTPMTYKELISDLHVALEDMKTMASESKTDIEQLSALAGPHQATICIKRNLFHITETYYGNVGLSEQLSIGIAQLRAVVQFSRRRTSRVVHKHLRRTLSRARDALKHMVNGFNMNQVYVEFELVVKSVQCGEQSESSTFIRTLVTVLARLIDVTNKFKS